jgi:putative transport protein
VAATGLALGSIRAYGISLGVAGVLFSGLLFAHFGLGINEHVLEFAREFGLILFVYSIGIQVGPGFVSSLRREGLPLNLMAASIVLLGAVVAVVISFAGGVEMPVAVGLFSGATTNTPSLAAAQSALRDVAGYSEDMSKLPGLGYAVAYPFGIIGIILTMILVRVAFRVNVAAENEALLAAQQRETARLTRMNIEIQNPNLEGMKLRDVPMLDTADVVVSRVMKGDTVRVAQPDTVLSRGDVLLAVGPKQRLEELRVIAGCESQADLMQVPSAISSRRLVVTNKAVMGKSIDELGLLDRYGVTITRLRRFGVELPATAKVDLHFGDTVLAVGEPESIDKAAAELGNSIKRLDHPEVIPLFLGIVLGVIVGSWPFTLPGVPAPVRLGLAGGPLLVAILLSRIGQIGRVTWFMPASANFILREVGIVLFLACVGLKSGDRFIETLTQGSGFYWMAMAALITLVPLLVVALAGRIFFKVNYLTLCGLLAGSMTDPPALAFATNVTGSDAPTVSYATVYPLTMILRVLSAQLMVLLFMN